MCQRIHQFLIWGGLFRATADTSHRKNDSLFDECSIKQRYATRNSRAYIIETTKTESERGSAESEGRCSTISVSSQMGQHILPFFSSVVDSYLFLVSFLFLLFASWPSILPVLMWQAWEMKNWYFMSGKGGSLLLLFLLANVDRKGKKTIVSVCNDTGCQV